MKYATYKTLHNWFGVFLLVPVMLTSLTGVLWMHEKSLGIKQDLVRPQGTVVMSASEDKSTGKSSKVEAIAPLTPHTLLAATNLFQMQRAIEAASKVWGDEHLKLHKIELKDDEMLGRIIKLVAMHESAEMAHELSWSVAEQRIVERKGGPKLANGQGGTDWAKVVHDLHTGKWFNARFGFVWSDLGAVAILFLGVTGLILYTIPILKKRENRKKREATVSRGIIPNPGATKINDAITLPHRSGSITASD